MKVTYENKYKERDPKDTINIIENFFKNRNFQTKIEILKESECHSWSCIIGLYLNNIFITSQNGKGTSKDFCLASGYAELYERFCNKLGIYNNPILSEKFINFNKLNNGYFIDENEKIDTISNLLNNNFYSNYLDSYFRNKKDKEKYLNSLLKQSITIPYIDLIKNEKEYFDPRLVSFIMGSSGMSAGNSLEEALVQGISELFERYATELTLKNSEEKYYFVNKKILSNNLQNMINDIEKNGNKIQIFDLSYNFGLPVCMALLTNIYSYNFHINFGSAPVFDIAVERTITEIYQNRLNFLDSNGMMEQQPFLNNPWYKNYLSSASAMHRLNKVPETFLFNGIEIEKYNESIYLPLLEKNYTNNDFLKHYKRLCNELSLNIFYRDNSLTEDMFAIQIFSPNLNIKSYESEYLNSLPNDKYNNTLNYFYSWFNLINFIASTNNSKQDLLNVLNLFKTLNKDYDEIFFGILVKSDWMVLFPDTKGFLSFNLLNAILNNDLPLNSCLIKGVPLIYAQSARLFCTLFNFLEANYSKENIKLLFNRFNINFSPDFYENGQKEWYLFYYIIVIEYRDLFFSNYHDNYILNLCN